MRIKIHKVDVNFIHLDSGKGYPVPTNTSVRITYQIDTELKVIDRGISIPLLRDDVIKRVILAAILQHEDEEKQRRVLEKIIQQGIEGHEFTDEDMKGT